MKPYALGLLWMMLLACGGRLDDPNQFRPGAIDVEADLLPARCGTAGCHAAENPAQGLDLVSANVAARLVGVTSLCNQRPLVDPSGGPDYFFEKVNVAAPECGARMPSGGMLTAEELTAVQVWVDTIATSSTSTTT